MKRAFLGDHLLEDLHGEVRLMTDDDLRAAGERELGIGALEGVSVGATLDLRIMMTESLGDTSKSLSNFFLRLVGVLGFDAIEEAANC
jgi:hypothetical protein